MKGKELNVILHEFLEQSPLLKFLSKLSIILVFIYPLVYLLGTIIGFSVISQFTNLAFYMMLFSLALLLIEHSWLILMISTGAQALMQLYLLISILVRFRSLSINVLTDLCLFGALCVPAVLKFIADYKATHVPKPKAPKPAKPAVSNSYSKVQASSLVCPSCKTAIQNPQAAFCNVCGSQLAKPAVSDEPSAEQASDVCSVCGKPFLSPDALFCNGCGTKRPKIAVLPEQAASAEPENVIQAEESIVGTEQEGTAPSMEDAVPAAIYCSNCGKQCEPSALFCTNCGTPVKKTLAE